MYTPFSAEVNRRIGLLLMGVGIFFATPPGFPPDDILNIMLAGVLVNMFNWSMAFSLLVTYTAVPFVLIMAGAAVYPHNTLSILHGKWNFIKGIVYKAYRHPLLTVISVYICYQVLVWYQSNIVQNLTMSGLI